MIEELEMGFPDKIKLQKIKRTLRNNHNRFADSMYNSSLNFERIINAE